MATKNSLNRYSETVMTPKSVVELLLSGRSSDHVLISDNVEKEMHNANANQVLHRSSIIDTPEYSLTVSDYIEKTTNTWMIPDKYKSIDVCAYVYAKCNTAPEIHRVDEEFKLYRDRGLIPVLQMFIFLVDHFRQHGIVWGVGRGSSVASFVLFLIGIHKIDSLKYNLDITEFLK